MTAIASIHRFLHDADIPFTVLPHSVAFTAQEEAAATHTPGRDWAKAVICYAGDEPVQAVIPADRTVNLERLRALAGAATMRLAREDELPALFPECEPGATPPLGPMFSQRVFVDEALAAEPEIVFNAGTHTDAIRLRFEDFARLTRPTIGAFAERRLT
jgi:Ala-tRNA(Pro) deacylase